MHINLRLQRGIGNEGFVKYGSEPMFCVDGKIGPHWFGKHTITAIRGLTMEETTEVPPMMPSIILLPPWTQNHKYWTTNMF